MEIVNIFANKLFAIRYNGELDNEYDRLMELWTSVSYLNDFAIKNMVNDISFFVTKKLADAEDIQDLLDKIVSNNEDLETYFRPLFDKETGYKVLSFQKGKIVKNELRFYALKIDDNCFLITGGAIKMTQTMQEHPDTNKELGKLSSVKLYLKTNHVFDGDSFYELLNETK